MRSVCIIRIKERIEDFPFLWKFQGAYYDKEKCISVVSTDLEDNKLKEFLPYGKMVVATEIHPREANRIINRCAYHMNIFTKNINGNIS